MVTVDFKDNSAKILQEFNTRSGVGLNLVGARATAHLQKNTPVRTGNLVNHADWEVGKNEKYVEVGFKHDPDPQKDPDYAIYVEEGSRTNRANHMLRRAVTEHDSEFKAIMKQAYTGL